MYYLAAELWLGIIGAAFLAYQAVRSRGWQRLWWALGIVGLGVLSLPVTVPLVGWSEAYSRCGHAPVVASNAFAGYDYTVPGDPRYGPGSFPLDMPIYYCTAIDAEDNGYHHNTSS